MDKRHEITPEKTESERNIQSFARLLALKVIDNEKKGTARLPIKSAPPQAKIIRGE